MKLHKSVYGLVDAPLQWYEALNDGIVAIGGVRLSYDKCAWVWHAEDSSLLAMLCAHVDDLYCAADPSFEDSLLRKLRALFPVGKEKRGDFVYCGLHVSTELDSNGRMVSVVVDQKAYIDKITPMEIPITSGDQDRPLGHDEQSDYRGIVGALLWATTSTRPDHAYRVCRLSQQTGAPTVKHVVQANKLLATMKKQSLSLRYPRLMGELRLIGYHDSSWGNAEDGRTVGGWIWILASSDTKGNERFSTLQWRSKTLRRVVKSTFGGETLSCTAALDDLFHIANALKAIIKTTPIPVTLRTDCASLWDHIYLKKQVTEKRLLVELSLIRDYIESGDVQNLEWIETSRQLADELTKSKSPVLLTRCLNSGILP